MAYTLTISEAELSDLAWVAGRYHSAAILYDALEPVSEWQARDFGEYTISEPDAWMYCEALDEEDGNCTVPPCIGGRLADELIRFREEIV